MNISVVCPVLNEVDFIGYSIMAAEPYVDEFIYALDQGSNDGTRELLNYIKDEHLHERLTILETPNFHPSDMKAYNDAFDLCIDKAMGDAVWFLHPDMIVKDVYADVMMDPRSTAWYTNITSYAGDMKTIITQGRANKWKNIHANKFGIHYYGGYGSQNEDFYHREITGKTYKHFGTEFSKYPFSVTDSGININHYCECKQYRRRFEKMKLCLKTLYPTFSDDRIEELATHHPRVTLEESSQQFGKFKFEESEEEIPEVFETYKQEFNKFKKESNSFLSEVVNV